MTPTLRKRHQRTWWFLSLALVLIWGTSMMVIGNCGLLQDLILDLNTDDELIQMNSIEMLSNLVCSKHGLLYMNQQGVLSTIENMLIASEVKPILLPCRYTVSDHQSSLFYIVSTNLLRSKKHFAHYK